MPSNPFGVLAFLHWNHDWNKFHFPENLLQKAVQQIRDLGVGFVRMDVLWSDVYTGPGKTDFSRYEKLITLLRDNDIHILGLLHYNKEHKSNAGEVWNRPPQSFLEFAGYVSQTVKHFHKHIAHWEIWNEPNHPFYWDAPKDHLKKYCELLKLSYQAAKAADSKCTVLNGGFTQPILDSVEDLYTNGMKKYFDVLSIHPFVDPKSPTVEKDFRNLIKKTTSLMKRHDDGDKKIWITEMGCPGMPNDRLSKWFQGTGLNEQEQAHWLKKQFEMVKKHPEVEKTFWAFYRDTGDLFQEGADWLGLVRFDLSPKPAYFAFQDVVRRSRQTIC